MNACEANASDLLRIDVSREYPNICLSQLSSKYHRSCIFTLYKHSLVQVIGNLYDALNVCRLMLQHFVTQIPTH